MNILPFPVRLLMSGLLMLATLLGAQPRPKTQGRPNAPSPQLALRLHPPSFLEMAQAAVLEAAPEAAPAEGEAGFLLKDAGIAAYAHLSRTLSLSALRPFYRSIERESDDYLIGSLPPPGYAPLRELGEAADVHAYIRKDGWIVVYLLAQASTAQIIDWVNYDGDKLGQSTLERTVLWLAEQSGVGRPDVDLGYYHFQYPAASALTLVADREDRALSRDTFQIKLPASLAVFERSWSSATTYFATCRVGQKELSRLAGALDTWKLQSGVLDLQDFPVDQLTEFSLYNESAKYRSYCGVAILHGGVGS